MSLAIDRDILGNVTPAELVSFIRAIPDDTTNYLSNVIMPSRLINSVKWSASSITSFTTPARFRAWDAATPLGGRKINRAVTGGTLPVLGEKFALSEWDEILLHLSRGENDQALIDQVFNDTAAHVKAIRDTVELTVADLLIDGHFSITDAQDYTLEAEFDVPAANLPTAATLWSDPTSKPLTDELAWIKVITDAGWAAPGRATTSSRVLAYLAQNEEYRASYFGPQAASGSSMPSLNPGQVAQVRATWGLPPITAYDKKLLGYDGATQSRVWPEDHFLLTPATAEDLGQTQYGLTAESIVLSGGSNPQITAQDAPGIVVVAEVKDDPIMVSTRSAASVLPVLYRVDDFVSAKVL